MKNVGIKDVLLWGITIVIIYLLFRGFNNGVSSPISTTVINGKKYEVVKYVTDTVVKTITQTKIIKGKDIYHQVIVEKRLPSTVDTIKIIQDYHNKVVYVDSLKLEDSLGTVTIIDTISNNKIVNRKWSSFIKQKTNIQKEIIKELPRNQIYFGFNLGISKVELIRNISAGLLLKTKKDKIYQASIGITNVNINNTQPYASVGMFWKIKLRK